MMTQHYSGLVGMLLAFPALAAVLLGIPAWLGRGWSERATRKIVGVTYGCVVVACAALALIMLLEGETEVRLPLGAWFSVGEYRFDWELIVDRLSLPFATYSAVLLIVISAFSGRYLHREPGFTRFYVLLAVFGAGIELVILAGSLDLIFIGWELVGLTSALLIGFFHERRAPAAHGLRAFVTYRLCDVGLLGAAVWLHHSVGTASMTDTSGLWRGLAVPHNAKDAVFVGLLLLWATMGKSAQVPLSGWLPRAMEGPTTSSAVFYGALSIHLGAYLLLRAAPILDHTSVVTTAVVIVGALSALHGTFVGRVQTDIKSALAYASMTQVGIIFVEIGLGLRMLPILHIVGHACIRTLQILRSPSLLHDHHHLEMAMGASLPRTGRHIERIVPRSLQPWFYLHALERGYFDILLHDYVVGGFVRVFQWIDRIERRWVAWLGNDSKRKAGS